MIVVNDGPGLLAALKVAQTGDTIALAAGDYQLLTLQSVNVPGEVRITSADPNNEAVIHGLNIKNSSNLSFDHLDMVFETKLGGAAAVTFSNNIKFDRVELAGQPSNPIGNGLVIGDSTNVTVTNSDIHDFNSGIAHGRDTNLMIANNTLHDLTGDGIRGGGSSMVTITGNTFTNFHEIQYAHNDAIQFWTANTTTPTHDLTITNNTFVRGNGDPLQGVFMNNEVGITYQNVTITGNAIVGGAYHGITVENAQNLTIADNLVDGYKDMVSWIQVKHSTDVTLDHNAATSYIIVDNTNITETGDLGLKQATIGDTSVLSAWQTSDHQVPADAVVSTTSTATATGTVPVTTVTTSTLAPVDPVHLVGLMTNMSLTGTAGADTLEGGAGGATVATTENLFGGSGDDLYIVTNWYQNPTEVAGGGTDTVQTGLGSYTLRPNVENLTFTGTTAQVGTGGADNNLMIANTVKTTFNAGAGNDTLVSMGGADTFTGGAGKDVFDFKVMPKSVATITDFTKGDDTLDLRDLLSAYKGSTPIADGWVKLTADATGTTVYIDHDGGANSFVAVAKLTGVTATLTQGTDWIFH